MSWVWHWETISQREQGDRGIISWIQKSRNGETHLIAIGKNPDGNVRIWKALKEPNQTVRGEHFYLPRQSWTMEEMAGVTGFSKTDVVAGSWPMLLTGSSSRLQPWNALVSDSETHQSILWIAHISAQKKEGERWTLQVRLLKEEALSSVPGSSSMLSSLQVLHVVSCEFCFFIRDGKAW